MSSNRNRSQQAGRPSAPQQPAGEEQTTDSTRSHKSLLGSSYQPSTVMVSGQSVTLGFAVALAHSKSGLTIEAWNELPNDEREALIAAEIDVVPMGGVVSGDSITDPSTLDKPNLPIVTSGYAQVIEGSERPYVDDSAPTRQMTDLELQARQDAEKVRPATVPEDAVSYVQNCSTTVQNAFIAIDQYMVAMAPKKPLDKQDAVRNQVNLYRAIQTVINRADEDFAPAFTALLKIFEQHADGVFSEIYVFRYFDEIALPENDRRAFQRLLNMIKLLGPVKSRELAKRQINMEETLKFGVTEPGRQRVMNYFDFA